MSFPTFRLPQPATPLATAILLLAAALGSPFATQAEPPQRRIYIANDDHTDYMWTVDSETYAAVFVDMLDYYLALADATEANPSPYQSRFNPDGSFWLWTYERKKSPAEFDHL